MSKNKTVKEGVTALIAKAKIEIEASENTFVKIAILGRSGTGKSTFINALANKKLSVTGGASEVTGVKNGKKDKKYSPAEFRAENLCFFDLPGYGTENFPSKTFMKDFKVKETYDCVLLLTDGRFFEADADVMRQLIKARVQCFLVHTKFDQTLENSKHDEAFPEKVRGQAEKLISYIKGELAKKVKEKEVKVFVVSGRDRTLGEFARLKDAIEEILPEIKREKFIENAYAAGEVDLRKKKVIAEKAVGNMALIAGAVGAVPDPIVVAGAAIDVGLLYKLAQKVLRIYGLDEANIDFTKRVLAKELQIRISQQLVKYTTKNGVLQILKRFAAQQTFKAVARWVPFFGQIIAGAVSWKMTYGFGEDLIEECDSFAREVLEAQIDRGAKSAA